MTPAREELAQHLSKARNDIHRLVRDGKKNVHRRKGRLATYKHIEARYAALDKEITQWGHDLTRHTADTFRGHAADHMGAKLVPEFSKDHYLDYYRFAGIPTDASGNIAGSLVGQKLDVMARADIRQLDIIARQTIVETALTGEDLQKALKTAWGNTVEGGLDSWSFMDAGGREWKNGNYFNMLSRTLPSNVAREAYADTMLEAGRTLADDPAELDLATIEGGGEPCPTCVAWRGVIISMNGLDKNFPSRYDALDAGVWHPNCCCNATYTDRDVHADKVARQKDMAQPKSREPGRVLDKDERKAARKEWNDYANRIKDSEKDAVKVSGNVKALKKDPKDSAHKAKATKARQQPSASAKKQKPLKATKQTDQDRLAQLQSENARKRKALADQIAKNDRLKGQLEKAQAKANEIDELKAQLKRAKMDLRNTNRRIDRADG